MQENHQNKNDYHEPAEDYENYTEEYEDYLDDDEGLSGDFSELFVGENNKVGVKLPDGRVVIPAKYDDILDTYNMYLADVLPYVAVKNGKRGLVRPDGKGTEITPFIYDEILVDPDMLNHFLYSKDGSEKFGLLFANGIEVIPCVIEKFDNTGQTFYLYNGKHWGLWQTVIGEYLEPVYDDVEVLEPTEPIVFTLNGEKGHVKVSDHGFVPLSLEHTMDEEAWRNLLNDCIIDKYDNDTPMFI